MAATPQDQFIAGLERFGASPKIITYSVGYFAALEATGYINPTMITKAIVPSLEPGPSGGNRSGAHVGAIFDTYAQDEEVTCYAICTAAAAKPKPMWSAVLRRRPTSSELTPILIF